MKKIIHLISLFAFMSLSANSQTNVLFGTCQFGGSSGYGTIFQGDLNGSNIHTVYSFDGIHGSYPQGNLVQANNGKIYGVTFNGGCQNVGVLFEFDPIIDTITYSYDFCNLVEVSPDDGMILGSDGNLYGLLPSGGAYGSGVLYRFNPDLHIMDTLYNFNPPTGGGPYGGLLQLNNKLYGMTYAEGTYIDGVIFSFDLSANSYDTLHNFNGTDGSNPWDGNLIQATDGKLYGMTQSGGTNYDGVIFSFDTLNHTYAVVYDFDSVHGSNPGGGLIQATDGKLYGMASNGGLYNRGVEFSFDISTSVCTVLVNFDGTNNGDLLYRNLTQASNGLLFGTTQDGAANNHGTAFSYNITTQVFTTLISFDSTSTGGNPDSDILEGILTSSIPSIQNNTIFSIFPIPASNQITIQTSKPEVFKFTDVLGNTLSEIKINSNISTIDISSFPNIFFVKSESGEVRKVVRD